MTQKQILEQLSGQIELETSIPLFDSKYVPLLKKLPTSTLKQFHEKVSEYLAKEMEDIETTYRSSGTDVIAWHKIDPRCDSLAQSGKCLGKS